MSDVHPAGVDQDVGAGLPKINRELLVNMTKTLIRIPTETPPSDTTKAADAVVEMLSDIDGVEIAVHTKQEPVANVVVVVRGHGSGKRLVLNGHLDTYPVGDAASWSEDPFSGSVCDGKLYGRGSCDMKGGAACLIYVFRELAIARDRWAGEVCLTLVGDEESMGVLGSQFLLETVNSTQGDAVLNADVGSPLVPRIGEKGMIWIDIFAKGRPAHGAHTHRGTNAIDALRKAMDAISTLEQLSFQRPKQVADLVDNARPVSEPLGGEGEADILQSITVNFGSIRGGQSANLVPDWAEVNADIRLPLGVSVQELEDEIHRLLDPIDCIRFDIVRRYEPTWTAPGEPIVQAVLGACQNVLGDSAVANFRVGASDARLFRAFGIPTVVCGLTPHNLGGPDEFVEIDEMVDLTKIHLLAALEYLSTS